MDYYPSWLSNGVDITKPVRTINVNDLKSNDETTISDFENVASYNWSSDSSPAKPVIIVPGKPDKLTTTLEPQVLQKSQHEQMCDENRHYQPDYPLESLFRSVAICQPSFDFKTVDFATDRNNLRKLLNFAEGVDSKLDPFRIDFQKIGNLIVLVRHEEKAQVFCDDYGKDFEKKYTVSALGQGSHRRIVKGKLGDLTLLTRFEVDCVEDNADADETVDDIDQLVSSMNRVAIDLKKADKFDEASSKLAYVKLGQFLNQPELVELTTKSSYRGERKFPTSKWNQMLLSDTRYLVIGWHSRGSLLDVEKLSFKDVSERCELSEQCGRSGLDTETLLGKLSCLLGELKELAAKEDGVKFSAICTLSDSKLFNLKIFKINDQDKTEYLPKDILADLRGHNSLMEIKKNLAYFFLMLFAFVCLMYMIEFLEIDFLVFLIQLTKFCF
jgi:hypothetical protein